MTLKRTLILLGAAALTAGLFLCVGCGGTAVKAPTSGLAADFAGGPCWVNGNPSCYAKDSERGNCMWGVGIVKGTQNPSLARQTGIARARQEIAATVKTTVLSSLKDYQNFTGTGGSDGAAGIDEQLQKIAAIQDVDLPLTGAEMVDSWVSPTGTMFVLCRLDMDAFKDTLGNMTQLSEKARQAVAERAEKAFSDLDKRTDAARNR